MRTFFQIKKPTREKIKPRWWINSKGKVTPTFLILRAPPEQAMTQL